MMLHPGYMRYYYTTLQVLAERGYTLDLSFANPAKQAKDMLHEKLNKDFPGQIFVRETPKRDDKWADLSRADAWGMDYLRYLLPGYENAHRLKQRVEIHIHPAFKWPVTRLPIIRSRFGIKVLIKILKTIDEFIPISVKQEKYFQKIKPDMVLVTPLVTQGSSQGEYFKVARQLSIPTAYCVASWDNLSSKGLIRGKPHKVILWNDAQKREAVEFHGIHPSNIIVTGAQNFDNWFDVQPSASREIFCRKIGLDPSKKILLYLCSSNFMAPNETRFVLNWIDALRNSGIQKLENIGILIRPYPEHVKQWRTVDLSVYNNVVLWPPAGEYPLTEEARSSFTDSIFHSEAVVGINTSAMIETAIIGRPVFTVSAPELNESQSNTIHFHYMLQENGGFLYVSSDLNQHVQQLKSVIDNPERAQEMLKHFVHAFIRPHGLDTPCVPLVVSEIEKLSELPVKIPPIYNRFKKCMKYVLIPLALGIKCFQRSDEWKNRKVQWKKIVRLAEDMGVDPLRLWDIADSKGLVSEDVQTISEAYKVTVGSV